jgi:hypothetical protein
VASVVAVVLLTVLPVVIYALVAMRGAPPGRGAGHPSASSAPHTAVSRAVMTAPRQR